MKDLKPSTRQRFVALEFDFPSAHREAEIVAYEGGVDAGVARRLVRLAAAVRRLRDQGLAEVPSTRLLVATARLMAGGIGAEAACRAAFVAPLTDDPDLVAAISDLVAATL
jgi:nitric oxide reductase NorQ protein